MKINVIVGIFLLIVGIIEFWGTYNAFHKIKTGQFKPLTPFMNDVFYSSIVVGCFAIFGFYYAIFIF